VPSAEALDKPAWEAAHRGMHDDPPVSIDLDPLTFGPDQACFGCGPHNERGLRLRFRREGDTVTTRFTLERGHDGPPDLLHGGLQATICDELAGWVLVGLRDRIGLTTSMQVRYIRGIRLGEPCDGVGRIANEAEGLTTVRVKLLQDGKLCCTASISYAMASSERMETLLPRGVPPGWHRFFDGPGVDPLKD
jgi:acyl-coenzyme A thioesterase PaaI-like protein